MSLMRSKPDLSGITLPPKDPSAFLEGATENQMAAPTPAPAAQPNAPRPVPIPASMYEPEFVPVATTQKLFRLRWDIARALKHRAMVESYAGRRVTETEIVERLLKEYLGIDG